jgi:hypothetical protein
VACDLYGGGSGCKAFNWMLVGAVDIPGLCSMRSSIASGIGLGQGKVYDFPNAIDRYYERGYPGCMDPDAENYDAAATIQPDWLPCDFGMPSHGRWGHSHTALRVSAVILYRKDTGYKVRS